MEFTFLEIEFQFNLQIKIIIFTSNKIFKNQLDKSKKLSKNKNTKMKKVIQVEAEIIFIIIKEEYKNEDLLKEMIDIINTEKLIPKNENANQENNFYFVN